MAKFVYESEEITVEAYGKVYTLPVKTPALMEQLAAVSAALSTPQKPAEQVKAVLGGISALLGKEETAHLFPIFDEIDTDELSALWLALSGEYEKRAQDVLKKYSPERLERQ